MKAFFSAAGDMINSMVVKMKKQMKKILLVLHESLPASLFIFKTIADPFVGRISLFKVCTGTIQTGMSLYNVRKEVEKVISLYHERKDLIETEMY